jgi:hypothetical protein
LQRSGNRFAPKKTRHEDKGSGGGMIVDIIWAFEILFEIPWCGKRRPA